MFNDRDDLGRSVEGNTQGITYTEDARRLQLLSARPRAKNRSLRHELALMTADCELQGFDEQTLHLAIIMVGAMRRELAAGFINLGGCTGL